MMTEKKKKKKGNGGCEDEMNDASMWVCHIQGV